MGGQLSRLRAVDRLVAVAALALALFMFALTWFGESIEGTLPGSSVGPGSSFTGWEAFRNSRWVWLLTILVALVSVVARTAAWRLPNWLKPGSVVALLGAVSALLVGYRILHHPTASAGFGGFHASFGIRIGIWLGFAAALAIAAGGYLQLREETTEKPAPAEAPTPAFTGLTVSDEQAKQDAP
ncbi:MAG TPA: hypothetical protein VHT25_05730 [Solirubrobacteraceae bacterium]|jgi:hypothetical protein|nr:hypothetical protein [Solirubrobacteraceae bacterium]